MEEIKDQFQKTKQAFGSVPVSQTQVIEHKYLLVLTQFPNGKLFPKIIPLSSSAKAAKKPDKKVNTEIESMQCEEVY